MSVISCQKCGGLTNTAVADHSFKFIDNEAVRCFARFELGIWVKGCAYNDAGYYEKHAADSLINSVGG